MTWLAWLAPTGPCLARAWEVLIQQNLVINRRSPSNRRGACMCMARTCALSHSARSSPSQNSHHINCRRAGYGRLCATIVRPVERLECGVRNILFPMLPLSLAALAARLQRLSNLRDCWQLTLSKAELRLNRRYGLVTLVALRVLLGSVKPDRSLVPHCPRGLAFT